MKPNKQTTIQTLLALGKSHREIARATGIDRKTIRRYADQAALSNSPGVATGSPEQIPPPRPPAHTSACEPWREFIGEQLRLKRNAMAIYQDLVDLHGFAHRYNSVKRFVASLRWCEPEQFDRLEFAPGEEAQVDYGEGALTWDAVSRRWKRPRLFVMTLRYSRRSFRRVVWKSGQQEWAQLHEQAFRYFGGAVRYVVLDNLKEGVVKPDLYEPELNAVYATLLAHYQCVADPARVRDPNKGRRFDSLQAQNEFLEHWECNWAAKRIHGREKRQVQAMFDEERASLTALPISSFAFFQELVRTVCDDTTVRVDSSNYAARTHARSERAGATVLPDEERPFNPSRQTELLWTLASEIGASCLGVCRQWFAREGRVGQRRMWGLVGLARKHPAAIVEQACARAALEQRATLKAITLLVSELAERISVPEPPLLTQQHELIRDAADYDDFFSVATGGERTAREWLQ